MGGLTGAGVMRPHTPPAPAARPNGLELAALVAQPRAHRPGGCPPIAGLDATPSGAAVILIVLGILTLLAAVGVQAVRARRRG